MLSLHRSVPPLPCSTAPADCLLPRCSCQSVFSRRDCSLHCSEHSCCRLLRTLQNRRNPGLYLNHPCGRRKWLWLLSALSLQSPPMFLPFVYLLLWRLMVGYRMLSLPHHTYSVRSANLKAPYHTHSSPVYKHSPHSSGCPAPHCSFFLHLTLPFPLQSCLLLSC